MEEVAAEIQTKRSKGKKKKKHSQIGDGDLKQADTVVEKAEVEKAEVVEKVEEAAICDRVQRMATYKPHTSLKLRIEKYKNPQKLNVYQRLYERVYGIWWVVPEVHYMLNPEILGERFKGERAKKLKLHFMEEQNPTPAKRNNAVKFDRFKSSRLSAAANPGNVTL